MTKDVTQPRRLRFGLGAMLWAVATAASLFAIFRVDFWGGLFLCLVPPGIWVGRVVGAKFSNNRVIGGVLGGSLSFALLIGLVGVQIRRFRSDPIAVTLVLICSIVVGALMGFGTELVVRVLRKPTRHRGLRVMRIGLAVLLVTGLSLPRIINSYKKRQTVVEIKSLNGAARSKYGFGQALRLEFGSLDNVQFLGPQLSDDKLKVLKRVPHLRILTLTNTQVTDEGLAELKEFADLNCLYIANIDLTKLVGPAAAHRNSLPRITGKGLASLKDLPNLQVVQLIGTSTTDQDLRHLSALTKLVFVDLKDTKVTNAGVAELSKALPNCRVVRR
jgi:hypothetical protein